MTNILRFAEPPGRGPGPDPSTFSVLGDYLRAVREHKDLSLAEVAEVTRVRRLYLAAIEAGDLTPLPSRPFAVGYVRAYAKALGLDGDAAAARFKAEHPEAEQQLRAPMGVALEQGQRRRVIYAAAGVLLVAVGLWNVAQRSLISNAPAGPAMPPSAQAWLAAQPKGPIALGPATAPPADQTTPKPYITPGLGVPGVDGNVDPKAPPPPPVPASADAGPPAFTTRATIYGADAKSGSLVVQAHTSASLVVRAPNGAIVFARELKAGEAYRAPQGRGLTADVSDPAAFDVYVAGKRQGLLSEPQTSLDEIAAAAAAAPPPAPATPAATQTAH